MQINEPGSYNFNIFDVQATLFSKINTPIEKLAKDIKNSVRRNINDDSLDLKTECY